MSRTFEIVFGNALARMAGIYSKTFTRAHSIALPGEIASLEEDRDLYNQVLIGFSEELVRAACSGINIYVNFYKIRISSSVDEFKIIYYLGRAIERRLIERGLPHLARVNLYSMISLLNYRLERMNICKPKLTTAMLLVMDDGRVDEQLGKHGCYLIYKTVSTTPGCECEVDLAVN
jgi:hypothetical protein